MCTVGEDLRDQREIGKLLSSHFEICRLPRYLPISQMISQMFITLSFGPVYGCLEQQRNRYHLKPRARAVSSLKIQPIFCHIWQFKWSGFQPIWNALNCLLFTAVQFVEATHCVLFLPGWNNNFHLIIILCEWCVIKNYNLLLLHITVQCAGNYTLWRNYKQCIMSHM